MRKNFGIGIGLLMLSCFMLQAQDDVIYEDNYIDAYQYYLIGKTSADARIQADGYALAKISGYNSILRYKENTGKDFDAAKFAMEYANAYKTAFNNEGKSLAYSYKFAYFRGLGYGIRDSKEIAQSWEEAYASIEQREYRYARQDPELTNKGVVAEDYIEAYIWARVRGFSDPFARGFAKIYALEMKKATAQTANKMRADFNPLFSLYYAKMKAEGESDELADLYAKLRSENGYGHDLAKRKLQEARRDVGV